MARTYQTAKGLYFRRDPETGRAVRISAARGRANLARSEAVKTYWGHIRGDRERAKEVADLPVSKGTAFRVLFRKATGYRQGEEDRTSGRYPRRSRLGLTEEDTTEAGILSAAEGKFGPHFIPVKVLYAQGDEES